jgi:hypothetical protein
MYVIVKTISESEKLCLCLYYGRILSLNNKCGVYTVESEAGC